MTIDCRRSQTRQETTNKHFWHVPLQMFTYETLLMFVAKARNMSASTKSCEYQLKISFISSPKTQNKITLQSSLDGIKPTLYFLQNISCNTIASNTNFDLRKTLLHQLSPNYRTSLSTEPWMHRKRASLVLFYHPYIIEPWQSKWNKSELKVLRDEKPSQSCCKALKNWFVCIEKCTDSCLE